MEKFKNNSIFLLVILFALLGKQVYGQNEFYNNGSGITVQTGALIAVQGEVVNTNAGANIGLIDNSGLISFSGNWTNNSNSGALTPTIGTVEMIGAAQTINGSQPTRFNNLNLLGTGIKTLNVNTFVSGATGALALGSRPLDLNSNTLFVTNPLTNAVTRTTGYIISETAALPGYGIVQWNIGNSAAGNYVFPFGSLAADYIPLNLTITTPGVQSTVGGISVSTYPTVTTPAINNRPLPTGVLDLNNNCGTEHATKMLDRFWVINTNNYNVNPVANKQFTYVENEWDLTGGSTNAIAESDLQAWYYNSGWTHLASTNASGTNSETLNSNSNYGVFTLGDYKVLNLQLTNVDSVVCFGQSNGVITFTSNVGYGAPTYSLNNVSVPSTTVSALAAGTYTVLGMDVIGCKDTISTVQVYEPAKLALALTASDVSICKNDAINLSSVFSGGIKPYSLSWSNGVTNTSVNTNSLTQNVVPAASTTYWLDLTDKNNCVVSSNTVSINVNPLPVINFTADIMEGCQPLDVKFTNQSAATPTISSWLWNFGTGDVSTAVSPNYTYVNAGSFIVSLKATSDSGCVNTFTHPNYVLVHPKPKANFYYTPASGANVLYPEITFENTSVGPDNVSWDFGDGSALSTAYNPLHTYSDTGVYSVNLIVSTIHNCVDSIRLPVKIDEISTLYVPNAFTPDGNGLNEQFTVVGIDYYDFHMYIFDRWGEKMFESPNINDGWDGKYRGVLCKEGVYVYKIVFKEKHGDTKRQEKVKFGHVTLLRGK